MFFIRKIYIIIFFLNKSRRLYLLNILYNFLILYRSDIAVIILIYLEF